jgi:3-hydroxyisobutyrate dehydrogenase
MRTRCGFIGLGNLGGALAMNLRRAGFELAVHDLDPGTGKALVEAGAVWAASPSAVGAQADAVFTCLPSPSVSERVLTAPDGLLASLKPGSTWIEASTVDARTIQRLAAIAAEKGVFTLEAPVTGGAHKAGAGAVAVIVGGEAQVLERHRAALETIGRPIFHVGPLGSASAMKVITNMLAFIHLVAAGEALMLARRSGLDLAQAYEVIKASSGNSFVHETESQLVLNGSYNVGFTMELACKDLGFATALGSELGVPLDLAAITAQTFIRAREAYGGGAWSTQVVKLIEDALHTDLRAPGFPETLYRTSAAVAAERRRPQADAAPAPSGCGAGAKPMPTRDKVCSLRFCVFSEACASKSRERPRPPWLGLGRLLGRAVLGRAFVSQGG